MEVTLLAHTQLSNEYLEILKEELGINETSELLNAATPGDVTALTAIRTCYSHREPTKIAVAEGNKYFGERGSEANRLFNHIGRSGHTSTLEHISFTFAIKGVSRALLAQLTRHRVGWSYSVQSQRYVHVDLQLTGGAVHKLQALGLTIVKLQGTTHRVVWGDIGFENDDAGYIPSQNELHQNSKRKKSSVVRAYERKTEEAAWLRYAESLGLSSENKNGIRRVGK